MDGSAKMYCALHCSRIGRGLPVSMSLLRPADKLQPEPEAAAAAAAQAAAAKVHQAVAPERASRGAPTTLHVAASLADVGRLRKLLATGAGGGQPKGLDSGDRKQYTAFHVACAGGHVECVRLLLAAGCDVTLLNAAGLTGWELAETLRRTHVMALRDGTTGLREDRRPQNSTTAAKCTGSDPPDQQEQEQLASTAAKTELKRLKVALRSAGLSTRGSKAELRGRLAQHAGDGAAMGYSLMQQPRA
eukprot:SAG22_NODE_2848_length_2160_cov_6.810771_2_plen_246_part_00